MKLMRFLGWAFFPYILILFKWRKMGLFPRTIGGIWSIAVLIGVVHAYAFPTPSAQVSASVQTDNASTLPSQPISKPVQPQQKVQLTTPKNNSTQIPFVQVGKPGRVGNLDITVNNLHETNTVGTYVSSKANGIYWVIGITIKNEDNTARTIDSSMFHVEGDNKTYDPDLTADMYANNNNDLFLQKINPGVSLTGYVVFDMPQYMTSGHIGQHYDLVSLGGIGFLGAGQTMKFALP